ncbi:DUF4129 domain-containing protein [Spirochaeta isovalerica]|uniref:Protein-glutamine gamma-glutamyltransferase-like C-terminal domain-containing protein n=1 Tax=Spirochaeta isovalerica TaxID=150 RepID=A0A841RBS6_9SPIO|nr:DUF4129 domain-containing protein [Spirochaeta isovalerica]MBB6480128.1 hypothetical protein [Spirochaeta isovalerica]
MRRSTRSGMLFGASVFLIILLISSIGEPEFHNGHPISSHPFSQSEGVSDLIARFYEIFQSQAGLVRDANIGIRKIFSLYAVPLSIAALIFLALMLMVSKKVRRFFIVRALIGLSLIILILPIFYSSAIEESEDKHGEMIVTDMGEDIMGEELNSPVEKNEIIAPEISRELSWFISFLIISFFIIAAFFIQRKVRHFLKENKDRTLLTVTENALDSMKKGSDYSDIILRCYDEMIIYVKEKAGIVRSASMTPQEFSRHLEMEGLPSKETRCLTALFEQVRYGSAPLSREQESSAENCLRSLVKALEDR